MDSRTLRLSLFSQKKFKGRRIRIKRGGIAIRDFDAFQFNNKLSSFRIRSHRQRDLVTLVLFSAANYQGKFKVFFGIQNVSNLSKFNFNNITSSLIFFCGKLSHDTIRQIQKTGQPPRDIVEIND